MIKIYRAYHWHQHFGSPDTGQLVEYFIIFCGSPLELLTAEEVGQLLGGSHERGDRGVFGQ